MAVREIRLYGDPVLRTVADPVDQFGEATRALAEDLLDTLAVPGRAGVAAPQIGVPLRAFSYGTTGQRGVVFNPVLVATEGEQLDEEGCLSVPGLAYIRRRAMHATVSGLDAHGEPITLSASGLLARCFQHETDHLNGEIYVDKLDRDERKTAMKDIREANWAAV